MGRDEGRNEKEKGLGERDDRIKKDVKAGLFLCFAFDAMQMRIGLFASRAARYCSPSLFPYLEIHSLQELLNGARLLPVSLTPLAPFRFSSPGHPVVQYLDVYELEVAYPVVHDSLPQSALVHLHHIDYVSFLKQHCHASIRRGSFFIRPRFTAIHVPPNRAITTFPDAVSNAEANKHAKKTDANSNC